MNKEYKFVYAYNTTMKEEEVLCTFRLKVLKQPYLYSNNTFKKAKPIKQVNSFFALHKYIQGFHFKDNEMPLYYTISLVLFDSYYRNVLNKKRGEDKSVLITVSWLVKEGQDTWKSKYKLPTDDKIIWEDKIFPLEKYNFLCLL